MFNVVEFEARRRIRDARLAADAEGACIPVAPGSPTLHCEDHGPCHYDVVPLPFRAMITACNVSAAMMLLNPFIAGPVIMALGRSAQVRRHRDTSGSPAA